MRFGEQGPLRQEQGSCRQEYAAEKLFRQHDQTIDGDDTVPFRHNQ